MPFPEKYHINSNSRASQSALHN